MRLSGINVHAEKGDTFDCKIQWLERGQVYSVELVPGGSAHACATFFLTQDQLDQFMLNIGKAYARTFN